MPLLSLKSDVVFRYRSYNAVDLWGQKTWQNCSAKL